MKAIQIHDDIIAVINKLNMIQQIKLLDFVKSMATIKSKKKNNLVKLAGSINKNELKKMKKAIEEDCEKINNHEW